VDNRCDTDNSGDRKWGQRPFIAKGEAFGPSHKQARKLTPQGRKGAVSG
jgi:hypothetical protein